LSTDRSGWPMQGQPAQTGGAQAVVAVDSKPTLR
jgi:hypothetical protein